MIPIQSIGWMRDGEELLADTVAAVLTRDEPSPLDAPSRLPGWNRATLVAHVAGNAAALVNLLRWAATGIETPMYASADAREDEIARWRSAGTPALLAHLGQTRDELDEAARALADDGWDHKVTTNSGRTVEARVIPWMRVREVYIHAVDLDAGPSFADIPGEVRTALIEDVVTFLSAKPDCPAVRLLSGGQHWQLGRVAAPAADAPADGPAVGTVVEGADAALLAWLIGRSSGAELSSAGPLPALPGWL